MIEGNPERVSSVIQDLKKGPCYKGMKVKKQKREKRFINQFQEQVLWLGPKVTKAFSPDLAPG